MILIGRGLVLADDLVDDFSFEGASPSSGDDSQVVTPVPMPNTEVKHLNAESSWGLPPVRIGRCQAIEETDLHLQVGFLMDQVVKKRFHDRIF